MVDDITLSELPEQPVAVIYGRVPPEGVAGFLGHAFGSVPPTLMRQGRTIVGPPFARYGVMNDHGWEVEAGFPVDEPVTADGEVEPSALPAGQAARLVRAGPYGTVAEGWSTISAWVADNGYVVTQAPWECYLDEPGVTDPRTLIVMPCGRPQSDS